MLRVPNFVKSDIDIIMEFGNLTEMEKKIFELRNQDCPPTIEQMAEMFHTSPSTINCIIKRLKNKIIRVL